MTSKKKAGYAIAKIVLLVSFLVYLGLTGQFAASRNDEQINDQRIAEQRYEKEAEKLIQQHASVEEMQVAAKKHSQELLDLTSGRAQFIAMMQKASFKEAVAWLLKTYLFLLPWFSALFIIWFLEGRAKYNKLFGNPISLLLSIIIYPVTAAYVAAIWLSDAFTAEELSTAKRELFSILSDDDIESLKRYARDCIKEILDEIHVLQNSLRQFPQLVCRCLDGFIMEIEHIPDWLADLMLINRIIQFKIIKSNEYK